MIPVSWSMHLDKERTLPAQAHRASDLPAWAGVPSNRTETAARIAKEYWSDDDLWEDTFGVDESCATVYVTVHTPDLIAGAYEVTLRRVVTAEARQLKV